LASEIIDQLTESNDPLERELGEALLKWQDEKARQGLPRSLGYEPRDIREKGSVAVIAARVMNGSSGFDDIDKSSSYEAIVDRFPDRFKDEVVAAARRRLQSNKNEFGTRLGEFLRFYSEKRSGAFGVDEELGAAMRNLQSWLEEVPAVTDRPTIKVKISVGQGGWTKTPWIALLDSRETTTTQHGTYIVFLIAEDLSITYLTLNQGMTYLRNRLGQRGATEEMVRVAEATRPLIPELEGAGFQFDNDIDLRSETGAAKNYEIGTIAHVALPNDTLPDDAKVHGYLSRHYSPRSDFCFGSCGSWCS